MLLSHRCESTGKCRGGCLCVPMTRGPGATAGPGTPRVLCLPSQASAHGWKALQRYMDRTLCLKTWFTLPKWACFACHRAAGLFAHSSWSRMRGWLSPHLGCGVTGEVKERVKVGMAEGWVARWISLGWAVTEFCMATLCLSWGISLAAFFFYSPKLN